MLENLYKRYGKNKVYMIIVCILTFLSVVIVTVTRQVNMGFSIEGQRFKYVSHTDRIILLKDQGNNKVVVTIDNSVDAHALFSIGTKYQIEYKDKIIKGDNSDWMNKGEVITLSDGSEYINELITVSTNYSYGDRPAISFDVQLVNGIKSVYDFAKSGNFFLVLLLTIPLMFVGLVGVIYPDKVWQLKHMLDVYGGEPTEWALFMNRLGGVLLVAFALLFPPLIV